MIKSTEYTAIIYSSVSSGGQRKQTLPGGFRADSGRNPDWIPHRLGSGGWHGCRCVTDWLRSWGNPQRCRLLINEAVSQQSAIDDGFLKEFERFGTISERFSAIFSDFLQLLKNFQRFVAIVKDIWWFLNNFQQLLTDFERFWRIFEDFLNDFQRYLRFLRSFERYLNNFVEFWTIFSVLWPISRISDGILNHFQQLLKNFEPFSAIIEEF